MKHDIIKRIENIIKEADADEDQVLFRMKNLLYELEIQNNNIRDSKSIAELYYDNAMAIKGIGSKSNVIKTGYENLDNKIGGFLPGEFIVIAGRPGIGKTQLLVNLVLNISKAYPLLYFTFDLSCNEIINRFISAITGIGANELLLNTLTDEKKEIVLSLESKISELKIQLNDSCNNSLTAFKAHCQKQINEWGAKVIVVDYLQMMGSNKFRNSREAEIAYITRELKNIARDNNICVIATSQLSRAVESRGGNKKPILSDLRESGAIEQDADKVIFIYRPEYYGLSEDSDGNNSEGVVELIIAKNRNGIVGDVKLMHDDKFTTFMEYEKAVNNFDFNEKRLDELDKPF